jgi:hypothetical protein
MQLTHAHLILNSHFPYHLNERLVFLIIGNIWFCVLLGLWDVYSGRWNRPKWAGDGVSGDFSLILNAT